MSWFQSPLAVVKLAVAKTKLPAYTDYSDLDSIKRERTDVSLVSASTRMIMAGTVMGAVTGESRSSGAMRRQRNDVLSYAY